MLGERTRRRGGSDASSENLIFSRRRERGVQREVGKFSRCKVREGLTPPRRRPLSLLIKSNKIVTNVFF